MTLTGSNFSVTVPGIETVQQQMLSKAVSSVNVLGKRTKWVDSNYLQDICDHLDNNSLLSLNPASTDTLAIVSTSTEDQPGGIGTHIVNVVYLDVNGLEQNVNVTMNGTTPVTLPFNAIAIQRLKAVSGGAFATTYGDITVYNVDTSVVYEKIAVNGNRSLSAKYTIPADKYGIVTNWGSSCFNQSIDFRLRATVDEDTNLVSDRFHFKGIQLVGFNQKVANDVVIYCPPFTEIKVSGSLTITSGSPAAAVHFYVSLFDNE